MQLPTYSPRDPSSQYTLLCDLSRTINSMGVICLARSLPASWVPAAEKPAWAALATEFTACLTLLRRLNELRKQQRAAFREIVEGEALNARAAGLDATRCFEAYIQPAASQEPVVAQWEQQLRQTLARCGDAKDAYLAQLNEPTTAPTGLNLLDGQPLPLRSVA